jgi:hypothetical protein
MALFPAAMKAMRQEQTRANPPDSASAGTILFIQSMMRREYAPNKIHEIVNSHFICCFLIYCFPDLEQINSDIPIMIAPESI